MPTFVNRVRLQNYKSIKACDVALGPLTVLVGTNGSGKSNFVDALHFVTDALDFSLEQALRERGGINDVRRRSGGHPTHFAIGLDLTLQDASRAYYAFRIGSKKAGGFEVQVEQCSITGPESGAQRHSFKVVDGSITGTVTPATRVARERPYLAAGASLPEFAPLFTALSSMGFYNLNLDEVRGIQSADSGIHLTGDGWNLASVVRQLSRHAPETKQRIEQYLQKVAPDIQGVTARSFGAYEILEFQQSVAGAKHPWHFSAANMSDGTLRALGILVALFQSPSDESRVPLVGIEEPELALHPAAASVLLDALNEASQRVQVIVTSHSAEMLDSNAIQTDSLLAVETVDGVTAVGPVDEAGRSALRDHLFTPGELLRSNQLAPSKAARELAEGEQLRLFDMGR